MCEKIKKANTGYGYMHFFCHSLRLSLVTLSLVGFPPPARHLHKALSSKRKEKNERAAKDAEGIK